VPLDIAPAPERRVERIHARRVPLFALAACLPSSYTDTFPPLCDPSIEQCPPSESTSGSTGTTGGDPTDGLHTVTGPPTTGPATSDESSTSSGGSTGPSEALPPVISKLTLMPAFLLSADHVDVIVEVEGEGAESVTISVDQGVPATITADDMRGTSFSGKILVTGESWNDNNPHEVTARALREGKMSEPKTEHFTVNAPSAGSEVWLRKSGLVPSYGASVAALADGDVLELFTRPTPTGQECHLRRRLKKDGAPAWPEETRWLAPGEDCVGEDLKIAPDGTIFVLVNVFKNSVGRWELHHLDEKGHPLGPVTEVGQAEQLGRGLDVNAAGDVLLCGTQPTAQSLDAWVRLIPSAGLPWIQSYDYLDPDTMKPDKFEERTQDCAFVGDRLVVVGGAWGKHEKNFPDGQLRGFALELGLSNAVLEFVVNSAEAGWHSDHAALARDGDGGYITAGHRCATMVTPCTTTEGRVGWFELGGKQTHAHVVANARRLHDVARSPGGYAVVAGERTPLDSGFLVQAWPSDSVNAIFDYKPLTTPLQAARSVTVSEVGFIYAGGYFKEIDDTLRAGVAMLHPY